MRDSVQSSRFRPLPRIAVLPYALYRAEQVRALDRAVIDEFGIPGGILMERAGAAAFRILRERWGDVRSLTVLCGVGNNGGDGYVIARLALEGGYRVQVLQLGDSSRLQGDALEKASLYRSAGGTVEHFTGLPRDPGVIVDAILGTGLERPVQGQWADSIRQVNDHPAPVLAIDIPSGLHADTGTVLGVAVEADVTISFICLKQGMFTGNAPDCCGEIRFDGLEVPAAVYARQIASARRVDWQRMASLLGRRRRAAHKGDFGHVVIVGGAPGFSGAARMAGEAAARSGAGLVSVATAREHAAWLNLGRPELMCHGVGGPSELRRLLDGANCVAVGPGLGQTRWARELFEAAVESGLPLVVDADALNLLSRAPRKVGHWLLTPHPGEAARLLRCTPAEVQRDRFSAAARLQEAYGGVVVLKGAGTLVQGGPDRPPAVCSQGNPGMASGGMGDALTGIVAALLAQGLSPEDAACAGVCVHAAAGDAAASEGGERGLLATDLLPQVRRLVNP